MRILISLGGNALFRRGEAAETAARRRSVAQAARVLASIAEEHEVVIAHGNAEGESMVGHMLELALRNELPDRDLVTVLSETVVSAEDPAFDTPSTPTGPEPQAIIELRSIRTLIDSGALVICAGGGGASVTIDAVGVMRGVETVVDEDLTAALLGRRLDVDLLILLTDVDAVHLGWGTAEDTALGAATPEELRELSFAGGSMGPKVEAACRFVEKTGRRAAIGDVRDGMDIVVGRAGTQIRAVDTRLPSA